MYARRRFAGHALILKRKFLRLVEKNISSPEAESQTSWCDWEKSFSHDSAAMWSAAGDSRLNGSAAIDGSTGLRPKRTNCGTGMPAGTGSLRIGERKNWKEMKLSPAQSGCTLGMRFVQLPHVVLHKTSSREIENEIADVGGAGYSNDDIWLLFHSKYFRCFPNQMRRGLLPECHFVPVIRV